MKLFFLLFICAAFVLLSSATTEKVFENSNTETKIDIEKYYHIEEKFDDYSDRQEELFKEFESSEFVEARDRNVYILSNLWRSDYLKNSIKDKIAEKHFRFILYQVYGNYQAPNFNVLCTQSFPFPSVNTEFTSTMYKNGKVESTSNTAQCSHSMKINSSVVASRIGGIVKNGDVIQYKIVVTQWHDNNITWEKTFWTNKVVAKGLKEDRNVENRNIENRNFNNENRDDDW